MRIDVVTIFPDYLKPLELSLIGRARAHGLVTVHAHNLRDFTHDRHRTVDDTPYGGGAGMVMRPEPWGEALDHVLAAGPPGPIGAESAPTGSPPHLLVPSPAGVRFTQAMATDLATQDWLIFACGRYEGIDERVVHDAAGRVRVTPVSLGDYVLSGGEVASLAIIEAVIRLVPGVVGNPQSLIEESHGDGLLEYPVFTKPASWRGLDVPPVLLSGDHEQIAAWRRARQIERTIGRRPDLLPPTANPDLAGLHIAPATPADVGELFTLQRACWLAEAQDNPGVDIPALMESIQDAREALQQWRTVVARHNGRLVASARARGQAQQWHIGRIMVAPDLQGRGWGRALLDLAESWAPIDTIEFRLFTGALSHSNQRLYRKAGYRARADLTPPEGAVIMTKGRRA